MTTDDGYILGLWRINGNLNNISSQPPVLLQHGLGSDMMQWVMNKAENAPAFILAQNGYDVWLGNNRGNRFSQSHITLDST